MTHIKSALEIALEKTENVKSDRETLEAHNLKQEGRRIASRYLNNPDDPEASITKHLKQYDREKATMVKEGIFQTMVANISIPHNESQISRIDVIERALSLLINDKRALSHIVKQLKQFFHQYLQNREQVRQTLEERFKPKLREKERELSKRLGVEVQLDISQEPEFAANLKQNLVKLEERYQEVLNQAKTEIEKLFKA